MIGGNVETIKKILKQLLTNKNSSNRAKARIVSDILKSQKPYLDELVDYIEAQVKPMKDVLLENELKQIFHFKDKFTRLDCTINQYMEESKEFFRLQLYK